MHIYGAAYTGGNAVKFAHACERNRIGVNWMTNETPCCENKPGIMELFWQIPADWFIHHEDQFARISRA